MENNVGNRSPLLYEKAIRVFAVVGFVAILGAGMWGSVKVAQKVPSAFSSLASAFVSLKSVFVPAHAGLTLFAPSSAPANAPFTFSWTNPDQKTAGSYTFRYDCANGTYFTSPSPSGGNANVYCNVPFNFVNSNNSVALTPVLFGTEPISVTVHIDFTPNGASAPSMSGAAEITVLPAAAPSATTTPPATHAPARPSAPTAGPATTRTFVLGGGGAPRQSDSNGYVDFSVRIIGTGVVDTNGAFTAVATPSLQAVASSSGRIAVRFAVENVGTKTSPEFGFTAHLPVFPDENFTSPIQQALAPGDRIEYTLGFDQFDPTGDHVFTVSVDPWNRIGDRDKTNDSAMTTLTVLP